MPHPTLHRRFDCHMHTPLCGHAAGLPVDYVEAAAARGYSLITFTCHIPMRGEAFAQQGIRMRAAELPRYRELVAAAGERGRQLGVEVLCGIEAEISPDAAAMADMDALLAREPFDFVLGSLHANLQDFRAWLARQGCDSDADRIRAYFECLAEAAGSGRYDSLSHPDVIRLYGTLRERFDPLAHEPVITRCLDAVAQAGVCMEINTSGLIKGDFEVHPDPVIMEWALARDIPFTIGSDAHAPDHVGQFFAEVLDLFTSMGLSRLHYFRKRQRVAVAL